MLNFILPESIARYISLLIAGMLLFSLSARAQGNLLVTPKRVLFEKSTRSEILNLSNTGSDTTTFVISFIQIRMRPDGSFEKIIEPDSGQNFADKNVRFFPRTVTLAPNEAQTVKLQLLKPEQLKSGEYRSHLYLRAVPQQKPLGETEPDPEAKIAVQITPIFGISIPVIIRVGENDSRVKLSDLNILADDPAGPSLKCTFTRSGNMSVYGDVQVDYLPLQGRPMQVASVKGIALYTPNSTRRLQLPLEKMKGIDYRSGKLRIIYKDQSGKPATLAEEYLELR